MKADLARRLRDAGAVHPSEGFDVFNGARSKYGAKKCDATCNRAAPWTGKPHDSGHECREWQRLRLLERAGVISRLREQVKYELSAGQRAPSGKWQRGRALVIDFEYIDQDGRVVLADAKGMPTPDWLTKAAWLLEKYSLEVVLI